LQRVDLEASDQAQQTDLRIDLESSEELGDEPMSLQEHVVVPHQKQGSPGFSEAPVVAADLVDVVLMDPAEEAASPGRLLSGIEVGGRVVLATVLDDDQFDRLVAGVTLPAIQASLEDRSVVEGRDDDGKAGHRAKELAGGWIPSSRA